MCPIGMDQTERMSQRWNLLAPRVKEMYPLSSMEREIQVPLIPRPSKYNATPLQCLFSDKSWNSWSRLARPSLPSQMPSPPPREAPSPWTNRVTIRKTEFAPLERMPAELLALILASNALEKEDVLALGLSSTTLWPHAIQHVRKACYKAAAPWADTPIVCVGNYLQDLPPVLAADHPEPAKPEHMMLNLPGQGSPIVYHDQMCWARKVNRAAVQESRNVAGRDGESACWTAAVRAHLATAKIAGPLALQMEQDVAGCAPLFASAPDAAWVLRNLTTREFVRCRAPAPGKAAHVDHPDAEWIRVDDVLLLRICWSTIDHWRRAHVGEQELPAWERGAWAGHSFEIVALPQGKAGAMVGGEESWKDVTVEVVEQARRFDPGPKK